MAGHEKKENDFFNFWSKEKVVRYFFGVRVKLARLYNLYLKSWKISNRISLFIHKNMSQNNSKLTR